MAIDEVPDNDALLGRRAVDWLFNRTNGGHFFDGALMAVQRGFGGHVAVGALAPFGLTAEPTDFFLIVDAQVDEDRDWERLVAAHLVLYEQTAYLWRTPATPGRRTRDPFERFHLVMEPQPPASVPASEAANAWLRPS